MIRSLILLLQKFRREERAVAAVEFALITPFLLTMYLGSIEAAALFTADKRVNSVSATVGDLVSQWDADEDTCKAVGCKLPTAELTDYLAASSLIMMPYSTTNLRIVISLVKVKANGDTQVLWSRANATGTPRGVGTSIPNFPSSFMMNQMAQKGCIIVSEASYSYRPMLAQVFTTALNLAHTNYLMPRYGSAVPINLQDTTLAATACTAA
ncbi:MAG: pilus assembly protein [Hyphomicrobiales bacterium]|nr:MAG: pilus assembly protein [Hyphomicrobiales bacterium]